MAEAHTEEELPLLHHNLESIPFGATGTAYQAHIEETSADDSGPDVRTNQSTNAK